jgi:hypothetical protein
LLTGFYNRDGECLRRGTNWIYKYNSDEFLPSKFNKPISSKSEHKGILAQRPWHETEINIYVA